MAAARRSSLSSWLGVYPSYCLYMAYIYLLLQFLFSARCSSFECISFASLRCSLHFASLLGREVRARKGAEQLTLCARLVVLGRGHCPRIVNLPAAPQAPSAQSECLFTFSAFEELGNDPTSCRTEPIANHRTSMESQLAPIRVLDASRRPRLAYEEYP